MVYGLWFRVNTGAPKRTLTRTGYSHTHTVASTHVHSHTHARHCAPELHKWHAHKSTCIISYMQMYIISPLTTQAAHTV
jgi:hypothetical protein